MQSQQSKSPGNQHVWNKKEHFETDHKNIYINILHNYLDQTYPYHAKKQHAYNFNN